VDQIYANHVFQRTASTWVSITSYIGNVLYVEGEKCLFECRGIANPVDSDDFDWGGTIWWPSNYGLPYECTKGDIIYHDGTGWVKLPPGDAGDVLTSNGPGNAPSWEPIDI
jgi:hypothetical protein